MSDMIFEKISDSPLLYRCPEWKWKTQPKDYKGIMDGTPTLMINSARIGGPDGKSVLIPVQIEKERVYKYQCDTHLWNEAIEAMNSGEQIEVDEEFYWYFLEVLPPIFMNKYLEQFRRRVDFGFAEGYEKVKVFWKEGNGEHTRYFCQKIDLINPYA